MIIDIKKKIDTGKTVITESRVINEHEKLSNKEHLTVKEKLRLERIKKYGDRAYAKYKMDRTKNCPTRVKSLEKINTQDVDQTEEMVKNVIDDIFKGMNVIEACEHHFVEPRYFFKVLEKPEFREEKVNFINARITLAEYYLYRREKLEKDLLSGKIDPTIYSLLSSDYKYLAGKLAPLAYGDKIQLEANVNKTNTFEMISSEKVKELNNLLTSNIIDAEFEEQ